MSGGGGVVSKKNTIVGNLRLATLLWRPVLCTSPKGPFANSCHKTAPGDTGERSRPGNLQAVARGNKEVAVALPSARCVFSHITKRVQIHCGRATKGETSLARSGDGPETPVALTSKTGQCQTDKPTTSTTFQVMVRRS